MPQVTVDDVKAIVAGIKTHIDEQLVEAKRGWYTEEESKAAVARMIDEALKPKLEELRRAQLGPSASPITDFEEKIMGDMRGMFGTRMKVTYARAMELHPSHPAISQEADREQIRELQDLNDACVVKYWGLRFRNKQWDNGAIYRTLGESIDFRRYAVAAARAGYISQDQIDGVRSGKIRANEIMHPTQSAGSATSNLNFTLLSSQLKEYMRVPLGVTGYIPTMELPRPQTNFPVLTGDAMGVLGTNATVDIPRRTLPTNPADMLMPPAVAFSYPTFGQIVFAVVTFLGFLLWNDDMIEDSVLPFLPVMRQQIARTIARAREHALINGNSAGGGATVSDSDLTALQDPRQAWVGLRKRAIGLTTDGGGAALSTTMLRDNRKKLGKFGLNPNEVVHVVPISGWYELLKASEVQTAEKFPAPTVVTGVLAKLDGCDLVFSEQLPLNLHTTGVVNAGSAASTTVLTFNPSRFILASYGGIGIEETRWAPALATVLQAHARWDFKAIENTDGSGATAGQYLANALGNPVASIRNLPA